MRFSSGESFTSFQTNTALPSFGQNPFDTPFTVIGPQSEYQPG